MKNKKTWEEVENLMVIEIKDLNDNTQFLKTKGFIQHGDVTVYEHCIMVMVKSCEIAYRLKADVDYSKLIKGALLHDYFLYDWHDNDSSHRLHGFSHPRKAYENARRDTVLSELEGDIIRHHMFPLTIIPPQSKEAWIVCMADKICATKETLHMEDLIASKFISV